jgi:hypothetical protein
MGELEKDEANEYVQYAAMKRPRHVEEIASLIAFCFVRARCWDT